MIEFSIHMPSVLVGFVLGYILISYRCRRQICSNVWRIRKLIKVEHPNGYAGVIYVDKN